MNVTSLDKIGNTGLYSPSMFRGTFPSGKAGDTITHQSNRGKVTYRLGASLGTNEFLTAVTIISNMLSDVDLDQFKQDVFEDEANLVGNPILKYTPIVFSLGDLAIQMNMKRNKSSRVKKYFENLEMLLTVFEAPPNIINKRKQIIDVTHFRDFSLNRGKAQISVSNQMLELIVPIARGIRLDKVLKYRGTKTAELSLYVEYYQYPKPNGIGSYPRQVYRLDDLIPSLNWRDRVIKNRGAVIKDIQKMFDEMYKKDKDFPKYIYDEDKEFFYNKYKKGATQALFKKDKK